MNSDFARINTEKHAPAPKRKHLNVRFQQQRKLKTRHKRNTFKESGIAI